MNIKLGKIYWETGKQPSLPQLMTLRILNRNEEINANYMTIADDLLVYPDGTILNPPVINDLDNATDYVFALYNNDTEGGQATMSFTTPGIFEIETLPKAYYPGSQLTYTSTANFRDAMLPSRDGGYYSLAYTTEDWAGGNDEVNTPNDWEWARKEGLPGLKVNSGGIFCRFNNTFLLNLSARFAIGVHFYVAAADLPTTGMWPLMDIQQFPFFNNGVSVYVNCDTKKVHWRHHKDAIEQELISTNTINTDAWNQVLIYRPSDATGSQLWLNGANTFTGAFTAATALPDDFQPVANIGAAGGVFSNIYFSSVAMDNSIAQKYQHTPYPVGILEYSNSFNDKYSIPLENMITLENGRIVYTLPADVPTGNQLFYIEDSTGKSTPVEIEILSMEKVEDPITLDFVSEEDGESPDAIRTVFNSMSKGWSSADGGVSSKHIYVQDNLLVLEAHGDRYDGRSQGFTEDGAPKYHDLPEDPFTPLPWTTRVGAALSSRDYYGYGRYVVEAMLPAEIGVAPSFWISHYVKAYDRDPRYAELLAQGLYSEGDQYSGGAYVVAKSEIDMELPSTNANAFFSSVEDMLSAGYYIAWAGECAAVEGDPEPTKDGIWQLNNPAAPQLLESWAQISVDPHEAYGPRKDTVRCSNWKGQVGESDGLSSYGADNLSMPASVGKDIWDGKFHEFRFDWYADRVEFYVDGVMVQVNRHFVPDVAGRWNIGLKFPSLPSEDYPWKVAPDQAWAGQANWEYQRMLIRKIAHTPFTDEEAGGTIRLVAETDPFGGLKGYPQPQAG
ncbi:family 16 glycosylhydrolase [Chitinophaga agrisoli]|uniref:Family 16 glycosylhydrolase n=1 Tax=Chitinophaga agrisoli TaxID=2607653 RepID=A0A5B2W2S7_9BACT|nr:family 16 glycosylhydrolase [Chitinophaga agrisoli]KAA2244559.1 family 16 glycosylhydrolase [Chitinophaga agrisoli]